MTGAVPSGSEVKQRNGGLCLEGGTRAARAAAAGPAARGCSAGGDAHESAVRKVGCFPAELASPPGFEVERGFRVCDAQRAFWVFEGAFCSRRVKETGPLNHGLRCAGRATLKRRY